MASSSVTSNSQSEELMKELKRLRPVSTTPPRGPNHHTGGPRAHHPGAIDLVRELQKLRTVDTTPPPASHPNSGGGVQVNSTPSPARDFLRELQKLRSVETPAFTNNLEVSMKI